MKATSVNMRPCRISAAERHNRREHDLDYINKELTPRNHNVEWVPVSEQLDKIRKEYKRVTGQRLQPTSQPIQELVLVVEESTTAAQVEYFCDLIKELGMTPLSYSIHKDEGHFDAFDNWIPNFHAHIIVDTTCWEHKQVLRPQKTHGKNKIDQATGKPVMIPVDGYAKTIKFTRSDLSKLQDIAAEATGMKRGVSSERHHEEARQYKAKAQAREISRLAEVIDNQRTVLEHNTAALRESVEKMRQNVPVIVKSFDDIMYAAKMIGFNPDDDVKQERNYLCSVMNKKIDSVSESDLTPIAQEICEAFAGALVISATITSWLSQKYERIIDGKQKLDEELTRRMKTHSILATAKESLCAKIGKPANEQIKNTTAENNALRSALQKEVQRSNSFGRQLQSAKNEVEKLNDRIHHLEDKVAAMNYKTNALERINNENNLAFRMIAEAIVAISSPEQVSQYEKSNIAALIGEKNWEKALNLLNEAGEDRNNHKCLSIH